jgi:hypothetical protein
VWGIVVYQWDAIFKQNSAHHRKCIEILASAEKLNDFEAGNRGLCQQTELQANCAAVLASSEWG